MLTRLMLFVSNHTFNKYLFDVKVQERIWRQRFFYNAFRALSFNGIDGDYNTPQKLGA